ncbi:hypothetical protein ABZZ17_00380 [Streptomyces sp. NPDC006512]|uniref:hypothetical protein n=1 Tax=Streptomyces sp. NPDC006512 TaxID=3154307 RepID=UPI0033AB9180
MAEEEGRSAAAGQGASTARGAFAGFLDNPVVGMAPWIVFSLLVGPGRFEVAVALALGVSLVLVVGGRIARPGTSWKLLELADLIFFAALSLVGLLADSGTLRWLETYAGELSNIALVVIAFGSMALRTPFTLQYAREQVDRAHWNSPEFLRANYVITGVWGLAFLVSALAGAYGDLVLHNPNNLWTGWIIQIAAIVAAVRFTVWYPEVVRARAQGHEGGPLSPAALLTPVAGVLVPAGIAVLVFDGDLWWLGVALIVGGGALTRALHRQASRAPDGSAPA